MELIPYTDPRLRLPSEPVTDFAPHARTVELMLELMNSLRGACLSAPQIGLNLRFFVTKYAAFPVVFNPAYLFAVETGRTSAFEGSLSRPNWHTFVARPQAVGASFTKPDGCEINLSLAGYEARVFQHATDTLNGRPIF